MLSYEVFSRVYKGGVPAGFFAATGSLSTARAAYTATLLPNGHVLVAGGYNDKNNLASAELYSPESNTFKPTGSMRTARFNHTATLLLNGQVLITGGEDAGGTALASADLYNPATGTFTSTGSMSTGRYYHTPRGCLTAKC